MAEPEMRPSCATQDLSQADALRMVELEVSYLETMRSSRQVASLIVPVHFIHVTDGAAGKVSDAMRDGQIQVMNDLFAPGNISFEVRGVTEVNSPQFFRMGHKSQRERDCKTAHRAVDPSLGLNFYTCSPPGTTLGWATFPQDMAGDPAMDGVVMDFQTLPGGTRTKFNLGKTGAHEVGHWLGLYHTFQGGCTWPHDMVEDTPSHAGPNFNKPGDAEQPGNLCPGQPAGTKCPFHNIMNYVDDDTMDHFTPGQFERIWAQVGMFRQDLLVPAGQRGEAGILNEAIGTGQLNLPEPVEW